MIYKYSNKIRFVIMIITGFIISLQNILIAYMVQNLTNIATNRNWNNIGQYLEIFGVGFLLVLISGLIFNRTKTKIIKEVNVYLRTFIFRGMLNQSKENNKDSLGFLTNDFKLLETNRFDAQIEIVLEIFSLVLALGYALSVNWLITILFLIGSLVPMLVSNLFQKKIQNSSENWTNANADYVNKTKNFLNGSDTVRLYQKQENAVLKNKIKIDKLESALQRMNQVTLDTNTWINFVAPIVTFMFPFLVGIYLVVTGQTKLGALFAIVQLSNSFVNPILVILDDRNKLSTTKKITKKVTKFLNEADNRQETKLSIFNNLDIENLKLLRKYQVLIKNLNLNISQGQKVAIIGPSGSGKSTLLQFLLYGKYGKATKVQLNDKNVKVGSFSNLFSYSSQSPVIFSDSLWFNLTLGADISQEKVKKVCEELELGKLINEKGFEYQLGVDADQLSGGQLARIELARAILAERPVLLLDEINASLDKKTSDIVHKYLLNSNLTFLEIIHHYEPKELSRYDKVIDLNDYLG